MPEAEQNATRILSATELTALLAEVDAPEGDVDKRNRQRRELSIRMAFMPVSTGGKRSPDQAVRVTAKDISETGIGLLHEGPLPSKLGVVCFKHPAAGDLAIEVAVLWTDLDHAGFYKSGCRMLRKTTSAAS